MPTLFTPATIVAAFLFGVLCSYLAYKRGRSPYRWFFIGFLLGILGLIALFAVPSRNRRAASAPVIAAIAPALVPVISGPADKFWYYLDASHQQQGPMSHNALSSALREGKISLATYVWNEEMADWKILQDLMKG